ncbi:unnamed protein product [Cercospora beticola]|nr:unnamed protein product [Cercospora beticola]
MEPTDDKKLQESYAREVAEAEQRLVFERERSLDNAEEVDGVWRERLAPGAELERLKQQWKEQGLPGPSLNNTPFRSLDLAADTMANTYAFPPPMPPMAQASFPHMPYWPQPAMAHPHSLPRFPFEPTGSPCQAAGYLQGLGAVSGEGTRRHRLNPRAAPFVPTSPLPTTDRQKRRRDSEQSFYTASEAAASTDSFHTALEPTIVSEGDGVAGKILDDQRK